MKMWIPFWNNYEVPAAEVNPAAEAEANRAAEICFVSRSKRASASQSEAALFGSPDNWFTKRTAWTKSPLFKQTWKSTEKLCNWYN